MSRKFKGISVFYTGNEVRIFDRATLDVETREQMTLAGGVSYIFSRSGEGDDWVVLHYAEGFDFPKKKRALADCIDIARRTCSGAFAVANPSVVMVFDPALNSEDLVGFSRCLETSGFHVEERVSAAACFGKIAAPKFGAGVAYLAGGFSSAVWISLRDATRAWNPDTDFLSTSISNRPVGVMALTENLAREYLLTHGLDARSTSGDFKSLVSLNLQECEFVYKRLKPNVKVQRPDVNWTGLNGLTDLGRPAVLEKWLESIFDRCQQLSREIVQILTGWTLCASQSAPPSAHLISVFGPLFSEPKMVSALRAETGGLLEIRLIEDADVFISQIMLASLPVEVAAPVPPAQPVPTGPVKPVLKKPPEIPFDPNIKPVRPPTRLPPKKDPALIGKVEVEPIAKPPVVPVLLPKKKKGSASPVVGKIAVPPVLPSVDVIGSKLGTEPVKERGVVLPPKREPKKPEPAPTSSMVLPPKKSK